MSALTGGAIVAGRVGVTAPARPDTVRRHNLARLLEQVHRDGELTRADLTARLGLNRSTIGTLVGELVAGGLVEEAAPDPNGRGPHGRAETSAGRPSHLVRPRRGGPFVLAVDLEVDRFAVAAVGLGGVVLARRDCTVRSRRPATVARAVARALRALGDETPGTPAGIGIAVPGSVRREDGLVALAPNLDWIDVAFTELVRAALSGTCLQHLPVHIGNDANLGALAERLRGRARGHDDIVFLLGRIGVGAGIVAGSLLLTGSVGAAGEVGHLCLDVDGPPCHCGSRGCVEVFIGDAALLTAAGRPGVPAREAVAAVLDAAGRGDPTELAAVRRVARDLGRTIAALLNLVNPSVVVTGGTLARVVEIAGEQTRREIDRFAFGTVGDALQLYASSTPVEDSCLLGAAELALAPLLSDPLAFAC